jgi:hypothetical protein
LRIIFMASEMAKSVAQTLKASTTGVRTSAMLLAIITLLLLISPWGLLAR